MSKGYFHDYKGSNTQYLLYPVEEVAKSYWPTCEENNEFGKEFNSHLCILDNISLVNDILLET
ncbi:23383_t:CDS:2 [Dentiscutata erythropus]|uniref:23383_t:CDS:1 n=1 Tax=Dentiscutata erythropus TaxID=1348616 RepID=A0A9N9GBN1_9GLOM|nr:23383_t:CDS:2 [Dentiscutata erythropus]